MGCCLTTAATTTTTDTQPKTRDTSPPESIKETVKEVLPPPPTSTPAKTTQSFHPEEEFSSKNNVVPMKNMNKSNPVEETASEVSSDIYTYSYTASLSAATTTTIGTGVEAEDDGEVTQKVNKPPHVKTVSRTRKERGVRPQSLSPARKPVVRSMDNNNNNNIRLKKRTGTQCTRPNPLPGSRNVVLGNVIGREHCVRRMRSPGVGEAGRVVRRVKEKSSVENSGKRVPVNEVKVELNKKDDVGVMLVPVSVQDKEKEREKEIGESLENPLVSLECFIFL